MRGENFFYQELGLKPVNNRQLEEVQSSFLRKEMMEMLRFQSYLWVGVVCYSLAVYVFLDPRALALSVLIGLALIISFLSDRSDAKAESVNASTRVRPERLPPNLLELMQKSPEINQDVIDLMKSQNGALFWYQVRSFEHEHVNRQRQAVKQSVEGVVA